MSLSNPVYCAIDTSDLAESKNMIDALRPSIGGIKLGLEFYMRHGAAGYAAVVKPEDRVFLDVKLHDIPNTVAKAVTSLLPLKPAFLTLHTSGGGAMMRAASDAAAKAGASRPRLLGVTVLTSLDTEDLIAVGQEADTTQQVTRLARLAKDSGLDGVICSPHEVKTLRAALGPDFILMVPGIRPLWAASNDQKRIMTPREAIEAGASYLVIGRPITEAENPVEAAKLIASELAA